VEEVFSKTGQAALLALAWSKIKEQNSKTQAGIPVSGFVEATCSRNQSK
jgi:hypothetical protein